MTETAPMAPGRVAFDVEDAAVSDAGLVRAGNEDAFVRRAEVGLWVVADGMGGHDAGEWAAEVIARAATAVRIEGEFDADASALVGSLKHANRIIHDRAVQMGRPVGSTVVALLLGGDRVAIFWAGDSRAYRMRGGRLTPLTRDHTHVQAKVERGIMSPDEAKLHPMAHVLTRAVGVEADLDLAGVHGTAAAGDIFLLCSDGLHGVVPEAEIAHALAHEAPAEACRTLLARCHARGAPDNVTLIAIACRA